MNYSELDSLLTNPVNTEEVLQEGITIISKALRTIKKLDGEKFEVAQLHVRKYSNRVELSTDEPLLCLSDDKKLTVRDTTIELEEFDYNKLNNAIEHLCELCKQKAKPFKSFLEDLKSHVTDPELKSIMDKVMEMGYAWENEIYEKLEQLVSFSNGSGSIINPKVFWFEDTFAITGENFPLFGLHKKDNCYIVTPDIKHVEKRLPIKDPDMVAKIDSAVETIKENYPNCYSKANILNLLKNLL